MGMSVTAMAGAAKTETLDYTTNQTSQNVVNVLIKEPAPGKVYSVEVKWEALDFTYDFGEAATWNPTTHTYTGGRGAKWVDDSATVTITNHSNDGVTAKTLFDNDTATSDTKYGVTATIDKSSAFLASGDGLLPEEAKTLVSTITVSGQPTISQGYELDKVIVTIAPETTQ